MIEQVAEKLHGEPTVNYSVANRRAVLSVEHEYWVREVTRPHMSGAPSPFHSWWGSFLQKGASSVPDTGFRVQVLDLFSSVGGLSLGVSTALQSLGMDVRHIAGVDVDGAALEVYAKNLRPNQIIHRSVDALVDYQVIRRGARSRFAYSPEVLGDLTALNSRPDVLVAGPPCQGHSTLNNHTRGDDPKNLLYLSVPAIAVALEIPVVIIENVPNVVHDKNGVVDTAKHLFEQAGYSLTWATLSADKLGWAQTRRRYFLVACRDVAPASLSALQAASQREAANVLWAIEDLQDKYDAEDVMFSTPQLSADNQMRLNYLVDNGEHNLPLDIRPECHREGTTYGAVYGRMFPDRPAPTITTGFLTPGRGRFIHPTRPRVLTPREAARIQGFPDWFTFSADRSAPPSRTNVTKCIGDAVPSILGFTAAMAALPALRRLSGQ